MVRGARIIARQFTVETGERKVGPETSVRFPRSSSRGLSESRTLVESILMTQLVFDLSVMAALTALLITALPKQRIDRAEKRGSQGNLYIPKNGDSFVYDKLRTTDLELMSENSYSR